MPALNHKKQHRSHLPTNRPAWRPPIPHAEAYEPGFICGQKTRIFHAKNAKSISTKKNFFDAKVQNPYLNQIRISSPFPAAQTDGNPHAMLQIFDAKIQHQNDPNFG